MTTEQTGYDELLHSRVEQLKQIEERLDALRIVHPSDSFTGKTLRQLVFDVQDMIAKAEAEHANF